MTSTVSFWGATGCTKPATALLVWFNFGILLVNVANVEWMYGQESRLGSAAVGNTTDYQTADATGR